MRLLRLAVENQRWDLAAHTIVLATARVLNGTAESKSGRQRDKTHGGRSKKEKKWCPQGQSER